MLHIEAPLSDRAIAQAPVPKRRPYARKGRPQPYWEPIRRKDLVDVVNDNLAAIGFNANYEAWVETRAGYGVVGVITGRWPAAAIECGYEAAIVVRQSNDGFWAPAMIAGYCLQPWGAPNDDHPMQIRRGDGILGPTFTAPRAVALDDAVEMMVDALPKMVAAARRRGRAATRNVTNASTVILDMAAANVFPRRFVAPAHAFLTEVNRCTMWEVLRAIQRANATRSPYDQLETALRVRRYLSDHLQFQSLEDDFNARGRRKAVPTAPSS